MWGGVSQASCEVVLVGRRYVKGRCELTSSFYTVSSIQVKKNVESMMSLKRASLEVGPVFM